jgi:hypothetical protein
MSDTPIEVGDTHPARWWHPLDDGRLQCDLCPRDCRLHDGQRGLCFVRARQGDAMVLTTWGRSSGFCIDPIEKKPLAHFLPGSPVLSFGTAGCNLACRFCQNWDISKSRETDCWLEITTLLIPGLNDSDAELDAMTRWIAAELGTDVPLHFSAFHPDWKLRDVPATPPATLTRARGIALANGLRHVYTGNVRDLAGGVTRCTGCAAPVIERDRYTILRYALDETGACRHCGTALAGRFAKAAGTFGARRIPVRLASA